MSGRGFDLARFGPVLAVLALAGPALGGPPPLPTVPPPVSRPGVVGAPVTAVVEFALEDGTRPCMEPSAVPEVRYRIAGAADGIRAVEIKRVLSDGLVTDSVKLFSASTPFPTAKEERRIPDREAARYVRTLVGYKLEALIAGKWVSRETPFHFFPAMALDPEKVVIETIASTNGRGGATVHHELVARLQGITSVSVRGQTVLPSTDPRAVTTSDVTIVPGSPAHLRWTINWPDGTEAFWRGARNHLFTARQRGTCGDRSVSVGPIPGLRR